MKTLFYFFNLGIFCSCIALIIAYILAQTMHFMQDKPSHKSFKIHKKNTPLCGGVGIFIAFIAVVLGGIEMSCHYEGQMESIRGCFYEYAGLQFYIACCIILGSGMIKDIYKKNIVWLIFCIQMCGFCVFCLLLYRIHIYGFSHFMLLIPLCMCFLFITTNALNMLDGIHGNAALTVIFMLASLCVVAYKSESAFISFAASLLLGVVFIFLLFNYPFGRMFLGDSGAFLLGFCVGAFLLLCALHYRINMWYCFGVILYPICAFFSSLFLRAFIARKKPIHKFYQSLWQPHPLHMHSLLWQYFGNGAALFIQFWHALFIACITYYYNEVHIIIVASLIFLIWYIGLLCYCLSKNKIYSIKLNKV